MSTVPSRLNASSIPSHAPVPPKAPAIQTATSIPVTPSAATPAQPAFAGISPQSLQAQYVKFSGQKKPDGDSGLSVNALSASEQLPSPLSLLLKKATLKAAETGNRQLTQQILIWALLDTMSALLDKKKEQTDKPIQDLRPLHDLAKAVFPGIAGNTPQSELSHLIAQTMHDLTAQFTQKFNAIDPAHVNLAPDLSKALATLKSQPTRQQTLPQLIDILQGRTTSPAHQTGEPATQIENLLNKLENQSPELSDWCLDVLRHNQIYTNNSLQLGSLTQVLSQTLNLARQGRLGLSAFTQPGSEAPSRLHSSTQKALQLAISQLEKLHPASTQNARILKDSQQTQDLLEEFLSASEKRQTQPTLASLVSFIHYKAQSPKASSELRQIHTVLSSLADSLAQEPLLSGKEVNQYLGHTGKFLSELYDTAQFVAHRANSDTVDAKHLVQALLRMTDNLTENPEGKAFINANPDEIPGQILYARMALDALLPLELRRDLTTNQIISMIKRAQTDVSALVFDGDIRLMDSSKSSNKAFYLGDSLIRAVSKLSQGTFAPGTQPYELTRLLREQLPLSTEPAEQKLGQIMNRMMEEARKKSANIPSVTFDQVGGYTKTKNELKLFADLNKDPGLVKDFGIDPKEVGRGLILHGPPGNGKTYMAKAMANYLGLPFFAYSGPEFFGKYVGESEGNVRKMFAEARKHEKAVIFIDEADGLLAARRSSDSSGGDVRNNVVNTFLAEMDGFMELPGVIVIAATNHLESMDPAAIRPGRLGKHIEVPQPNTDDRQAILKIWTQNKPLGPDVDLKRLAELTRGSSSVELKEMAVGATMEAFKEFVDGQTTERQVQMRHFDEARDTYLFGPKNMQTPDDFSRRTVAHHEVLGHGLLGYAMGQELRTVTTIGRKKSAGHVEFFPQEGFQRDTTQYYLYNLLMTLGGRAAEELANGRQLVTGGARSDYAQARNMLVNMISEGIIPGHAASNYQHTGNLNSKDAQLVSVLLDYAWSTALKMIDQIPADKRDKMVDELTTNEGVQLRNQEAMDFFHRHVSDAEKEKIKNIADEFVQKVISTLDQRSDQAVTDFFKLADTQKTAPPKFSGQPPAAARRLALVG